MRVAASLADRTAGTAGHPQPETPAVLLQIREAGAQRLMMVYAITGLFFMLLPGTFLGVWNLVSISSRQPALNISPAWIQAHGHAQIFGWIGTFILGIGFYSIPKMTGRGPQPARRGWTAWMLWTSGVLLRWSAGFYQWEWRATLPLSAVLELCAFVIFLQSVRKHGRSDAKSLTDHMPRWILSVLIGTAGLGAGLLMNLGAALYLSVKGTGPAFPAPFESRLLALLAYGFIVPTILGFSARWLPVFLGLKPVAERILVYALLLNVTGVLLAQAGFFRTAPWLFLVAAVLAVAALHLAGPGERPAKTTGVHSTFPVFVRIAYLWLFIATALGIGAAYLDHANGWVGASRHALTVGFIAAMVFAVGQRILPAFAGMKVLYSPRLMLVCLLLLNIGCTLRVAAQILAYEGYWPRAWDALPWSAVCELAAVTVFAANLILSFAQPPAHLKNQASAAY